MKINKVLKTVMLLSTLTMSTLVYGGRLEYLRVVVNDTRISFNDNQDLSSGVIMVPLRFVGEQLGVNVSWESSANKIVLADMTDTIELTIGSKVAKVNGVEVNIPKAPFVRGSCTFVPVRFVSEVLGAKVEWDASKKIVNIRKNVDVESLINSRKYIAGDFSIPITPECIVGESYDGWTIRSKNLVTISHSKDSYDMGIILYMLVAPQMTTDYNVQCREAESILNQVLNERLSGKIMDYVKTKQDRLYVIPKKYFSDYKYEVCVEDSGGSVLITVRKEK